MKTVKINLDPNMNMLQIDRYCVLNHLRIIKLKPGSDSKKVNREHTILALQDDNQKSSYDGKRQRIEHPKKSFERGKRQKERLT